MDMLGRSQYFAQFRRLYNPHINNRTTKILKAIISSLEKTSSDPKVIPDIPRAYATLEIIYKMYRKLYLVSSFFSFSERERERESERKKTLRTFVSSDWMFTTDQFKIIYDT